MTLIENRQFPEERDLYGVSDATLRHCAFDGAADGESALKEGRDIVLESCFFNLRYPLWHDDGVSLSDCTLTENCRAALWYSRRIRAQKSRLLGIKALRECERAAFSDCEIVSPEFGWKCRDVRIRNTSLSGEYAFLLSSDLDLKGVDFRGKYSFQYIKNAVIEDCTLDTKDAFWHAENVTVKNCLVKGEYLGWYSDHLTFDHCKIVGTQPLCYCKNLKLVDCEMQETDFSFEYSEVDAEIRGEILSVKNPKSGRIVADRIAEILLTEDSKMPCDCKIVVRGSE